MASDEARRAALRKTYFPDWLVEHSAFKALEDIAALPTLLHVLRLEPKDRSTSDIAVLMQWTSRVPFFAQLSKVERMSICTSMTYRSYPADTVLMRKGEVGAKMYVIVTGAVDVLGDQNVYITTLGANVAFGQQALMGDGRRNATCKTSAPSELVIIERETFESSLQQGLQRAIVEREAALSRSPLFSHLPERVVHTLATRAQAGTVEKGKLLFDQWQAPTEVYFILSGLVALEVTWDERVVNEYPVALDVHSQHSAQALPAPRGTRPAAAQAGAAPRPAAATVPARPAVWDPDLRPEGNPLLQWREGSDGSSALASALAARADALRDHCAARVRIRKRAIRLARHTLGDLVGGLAVALNWTCYGSRARALLDSEYLRLDTAALLELTDERTLDALRDAALAEMHRLPKARATLNAAERLQRAKQELLAHIPVRGSAGGAVIGGSCGAAAPPARPKHVREGVAPEEQMQQRAVDAALARLTSLPNLCQDSRVGGLAIPRGALPDFAGPRPRSIRLRKSRSIAAVRAAAEAATAGAASPTPAKGQGGSAPPPQQQARGFDAAKLGRGVGARAARVLVDPHTGEAQGPHGTPRSSPTAPARVLITDVIRRYRAPLAQAQSRRHAVEEGRAPPPVSLDHLGPGLASRAGSGIPSRDSTPVSRPRAGGGVGRVAAAGVALEDASERRRSVVQARSKAAAALRMGGSRLRQMLRDTDLEDEKKLRSLAELVQGDTSTPRTATSSAWTPGPASGGPSPRVEHDPGRLLGARAQHAPGRAQRLALLAAAETARHPDRVPPSVGVAVLAREGRK